MQYEVPQFIEVEDKIFGPFTWKQFLFIVGGLAGGFAIWSFVPIKFLAVILIIPLGILSLSLAFYRPNDRPFIFLVEAYVKYMFNNKKYLWKKENTEESQVSSFRKAEVNVLPDGSFTLPKVSHNKFEDTKWQLDVGDKTNNLNNKDQSVNG